VNINKKRQLDDILCPPLIRHKLAIHISFNASIVKYALDDWPDSHKHYRKNGKEGDFYYTPQVYKNLGI
jgi:hypothetical protein